MKKRYWFLGFLFVFFVACWLILPGRYVVPILMYHNVEPCSDECPANTVSPEAFAEQMVYLRDHDYNVLSIEEYVMQKSIGKPFSSKTVLITFDDAYDDNHEYAFPVLKEFGFPATLFVPPVLVEQKEHLTWDQIREMDAAGFRAQSHTMTHSYLPDIKDKVKLRWEIEESKRVLEKRLGRTIDYFSYPVGGFNDEIKALVKEAGYKAAFATNRGYDRFNKDIFEINRIRPKDDDSSLELMVKLSGYYNLIRKSKSPY